MKKGSKRGKYNTGPKLKTEEDRNRREMWLQQQELSKHIPSLVKSDIRRSYSNIFTNVINSMNFPLLVEFLKHYCVPNLILTQNISLSLRGTIIASGEERQLQKEQGCAYKFKTAYVVGLQNVVQFWYNKTKVLPDSVYRLNNASVHTTSHSAGSRVVSDFSVAFTKLYDIPFHIAIPGQQAINHTMNGQCEISSFQGECDNVVSSSAAVSRKRPFSMVPSEKVEISDDISNYMTAANMFPVPIPLKGKVQLVMHLNSNMLIERMELLSMMERDRSYSDGL